MDEKLKAIIDKVLEAVTEVEIHGNGSVVVTIDDHEIKSLEITKEIIISNEE